MNATFKQILHKTPEWDATVNLRFDVLRKPLGLTFSQEQLDKEDTDYHLVCYEDGVLVACLILTPLSDGKIKMRQVATATSHQRKGFGQRLVKFSEKFAKEKGYSLMELNARDVAVPFYLKLDYTITGEPFEEVGIKHMKMVKKLRHS